MTDRPLSLQEVGTRFGKTRWWMYRNVARLRTEHGFPKPIAGFGNVYDPAAIEAWLVAQRTPNHAPAPVSEDDAWSEQMRQRATMLAQTGRPRPALTGAGRSADHP